MSDKLSALTPITLPIQPGDEIYIIRAGAQYKVDITQFTQNYIKFVTGYNGYVIIPAFGNIDNTIVESGDILIGKGAFYGGNAVILVANTDSPAVDGDFDVYLNNSQL